MFRLQIMRSCEVRNLTETCAKGPRLRVAAGMDSHIGGERRTNNQSINQSN